MILSTGTVADWVMVGRHPGMTLSATPRTVTDAVVAVRVPVTAVSYTHLTLPTNREV